jgi:hypothetical protein
MEIRYCKENAWLIKCFGRNCLAGENTKDGFVCWLHLFIRDFREDRASIIYGGYPIVFFGH